MAKDKPRRRQPEVQQEITIDGNKILIALGALVLLIGVGIVGFWIAGRGSSSVASARAVPAPPQAVAPAPRPAAPRSQPAPQSQPAPPSQPRSSSGSGGLSVGPANAPTKGQPAPDFSVPTLDGGTFRLADQRGKPTVIFFMAYWCPTCVPEAQALAKLHQEYGDKVAILALDIDPSSSPKSLTQFKQWAGNPDYAFGFDKGNVVVQKYKVRSLDATVIVDAEGKIVYQDTYPTPYERLKAELEKLVS